MDYNENNLAYFQKEMAYLDETRALFIKNFPKVAPFLDTKSKDPDVESIIENMAILTSRIRQELDENIPLIAESLINILMPSYTNPFPSVCMQEFAYSANKPKSIDKLLEKGAVPNAWLAGSIGLDFLLFFEENGVKLEGQSPSPELLEFTKTQKYKEFKEEKFKLIKKLLDHGQDPKGYILLQKVLTLVSDEKDLNSLLEQYKKDNR